MVGGGRLGGGEMGDGLDVGKGLGGVKRREGEGGKGKGGRERRK